MDEFQEAVGRQLVLAHQPGEGGAVFIVIVFLDALGLDQVHAQQFGDERAHALIHLRKQIAFGRIECVVQIEDPGLDTAERGEIGRGHQGHAGEFRRRAGVCHPQLDIIATSTAADGHIAAAWI